jgi:hypothetical protein
VVLVVAVGNAQGGTAFGHVTIGTSVFAGERDGRRVVVQPIKIDMKLPDGSHDQLSHHAGAVSLEQQVEGATDSIVIKSGKLPGLESEKRRLSLGHPFLLGVQRTTLGVGSTLASRSSTRRRCNRALMIGKPPIQRDSRRNCGWA